MIEQALLELLKSGGPAAAIAILMGAFYLHREKYWTTRLDTKEKEYNLALEAKDKELAGLNERCRNELADANDHSNTLQEQRIREQRDFLTPVSEVVKANTTQIAEYTTQIAEYKNTQHNLVELIDEVREAVRELQVDRRRGP